MWFQQYKEFHIMLLLRCLNYVCKAKGVGILFVSVAMRSSVVAVTAEALLMRVD